MLTGEIRSQVDSVPGRPASSETTMPLTRDFKLTRAARAQPDPAFAQALLDEATDLVRSDGLATAQLILWSAGIAQIRTGRMGRCSPADSMLHNRIDY